MAIRMASFELQQKAPHLIHTTYYSNFFLLRTEITINGEKAQVGVDSRGWLTLSSRKHEVGVTFDSLVTDVNDVLQQHGLHGVSNYWCEEVPLFELKGTSQDELKTFLKLEDDIREQLGLKIQARLNAVLEENSSSNVADLAVDFTVVVEPQLYLIIPDQPNKDGRPVHITETNFSACMELFGKSKLFDFGSIFRAARANPRREDEGPKDLAVLHRELYDVVNWYGLGMDLGVPYNELQKIRENHFHNNDMCRNAMLTWWFQNGWPTTWQALVNALSNSDMDRMARTIAIKYGVPEPPRMMRASTYSSTNLKSTHTKQDNNSEVMKLEGTIAELRNDIGKRDEQLAQKSRSLDEAEREKEAICQEMEQLKRERTESQSRCQELLRRKQELECALKEMQQQQDKQEKEVSDLKTHLQSVEEELEKTTQQIPALEEQLQRKTAELEEKTFKVECLRESTNKMLEVLNTERRVLDNFLMRVTAANISSERYQQEMEMHHRWMKETSENEIRDFQGYLEESDSSQDTATQITKFFKRPKPVLRSKTLPLQLPRHLGNPGLNVDSELAEEGHSQTDFEDTVLGALSWEQKKEAPSGLLRGSVAVQGDTIFVIGENSRRIHTYCLRTNEWRTVVGDCPHTNPGIAFVEGVLTAFGGQRMGQQATKVSSFVDRVWVDNRLPRMRYPHSWPSVLSHHDYIIVTGGSYSNEIPMVEVFSIGSWSWSKLVLLPKRFFGITTTVCANTYMVMDSSGCGYSMDLPSLLTLAKVDTTPRWKQLRRLWVAGEPTVATFRDRIIGVSSEGLHQLTEDQGWVEFDTSFSSSSTWSKSLVCVVSDTQAEDKLVVIGGCNPNTDLVTAKVFIAC